uniref:Guanylate cyclase n=1 Tax=Ditylenchus dipsaci TaxID=166011 RepID=A0A915EFH3_9BILA
MPPVSSTQTPIIPIRVGILIPKNTTTPYSFHNSAGAVTLALDRILEEKILPSSTNFTFVWMYEECTESTAAGLTYQLIRNYAVVAANERNDCTIGFKDVVDSWNASDINFTIDNIKARSRIVLLCFDDIIQQREFVLKLYDAGLQNEDYVFIFPDTDVTMAVDSGEQPFWVQRRLDNMTVSDGRDSDAEAIGRRSFQLTLDMNTDSNTNFAEFSKKVMAKMTQWPFYCDTCNNGEQASIYAPFLYDAFYAYGLALSNTFNQSGTSPQIYRNGTLVSNYSNLHFRGMTGSVAIGEDGIRNSIYALAAYNSKNTMDNYVLFQVIDVNTNITVLYTDPATTIWASRGGKKPLAIPLCGFDGKRCPLSPFEIYKAYIISGIVLGVLLIAGCIFFIYYIFNARLQEIRQQNLLWQIPFSSLSKVKSKSKAAESARSLQSGPSTTSTKFTLDSMIISKSFGLYNYHGERIIGLKHGVDNLALTELDMQELRNMRQLDHENLNRFYGISMDGPEMLSMWKFCSRGSIKDVLNNNSMSKDAVFIFSIIRELCEGIYFIHNSALSCHGHLKSSFCLIDERWQVKISYYGLKMLKKLENSKRKAKDLLWKAPELLRMEDDAFAIGTKSADVYSFGVIASEVVNMKPAWEEPAGETERFRNAEEIVYLVKKGGLMPPRPTIRPAVPDLNPALQHLIRDCWTENPSERPKIETIRSLLRSMRNGGTTNLMDHVFNMLEQYAGTLEEEVEERTKELVEEKKKSDILLYRMLPRQVADRLKLGQSVEPESYDCVTVFFSDVVSFTVLSSRLKPLQVVNLLNELYTNFDAIIAEHDVYKVETIGDGYLCVSGLPKRNGNEHASHVANMSLRFMRSLDSFTIPSMPNEKIKLRIGLHSGPCVAGVVGLAMPRYCLFGDTVNTASRMESSSTANRIHISNDTNRFLTQVVGGFVTESRGEVIIKGKGVMETFWLIGHQNSQESLNNNSSTQEQTPVTHIVSEPEPVLRQRNHQINNDEDRVLKPNPQAGMYEHTYYSQPNNTLSNNV